MGNIVYFQIFLPLSNQIANKWKYQYQNIYNGTLSSLQKENIQLPNTVAQKLRIVIENGNDQPLQIEKTELRSAQIYLTTRLTGNGVYELFYGDKNASKPVYDLENFRNKIPKEIPFVTPETEQKNPSYKNENNTPLFENPLWLWVIMGIVIAILGWFSIKMIKS